MSDDEQRYCARCKGRLALNYAAHETTCELCVRLTQENARAREMRSDGAAAERAAVVRFLREQGEQCLAGNNDRTYEDREALHDLADAIERGEHLRNAVR